MKNTVFNISCLILAAFLLGGCSSTQSKTEHDPFESFNRFNYKLNTTLDKYTLKPLAKAYDAVVPKPIDSGIDNVLSNLNDVNVIANDILQLNAKQASSDVGRLLVNSILGLGGIFDVAKHMGMPKHNEDFGQTLATWGVPSGPYLMLPLLGPKTMRSLAGAPADAIVAGLTLNEVGIKSDKDKLIYQGVSIINTRQGLLALEKQLEGSGLDPYIAIRENYLSHRESLARNGAPSSSDVADEYGDTSFSDDEDENEDEFEEAF